MSKGRLLRVRVVKVTVREVIRYNFLNFLCWISFHDDWVIQSISRHLPGVVNELAINICNVCSQIEIIRDEVSRRVPELGMEDRGMLWTFRSEAYVSCARAEAWAIPIEVSWYWMRSVLFRKFSYNRASRQLLTIFVPKVLIKENVVLHSSTFFIVANGH